MFLSFILSCDMDCYILTFDLWNWGVKEGEGWGIEQIIFEKSLDYKYVPEE